MPAVREALDYEVDVWENAGPLNGLAKAEEAKRNQGRPQAGKGVWGDGRGHDAAYLVGKRGELSYWRNCSH